MHMRLLSATVSRDRYQEAGQPAAHPEVAAVLRYFEAATFDEAMPLARAVYPHQPRPGGVALAVQVDRSDGRSPETLGGQ